MKWFAKIVFVLPYLLVFIASLYSPSDPDLGWHLKYGEYFFQNGHILRDNTFSVLMPDFHWANVSWGTDILTYAAFALGGFLGLTLLSALVITLTFFFFSKAARLTVWDEALIFPLILYLEKPLNNVSFRGQQISMLFLGVMVYLISLSEKNPKALYLLIPLFLLWVNLHGEFVLGLALFGVWIAITCIQQFFQEYNKNFRKTFLANKKLFLIFILSFLATIINPFGIWIHHDAILHVGSPLLKNIAEYLPFDMLSQAWWNQVTVAVLVILGLIFLFFKERLSDKIPFLGGAVLLYILSFGVRRYAWPAYYLIFPMLRPLSNIFKPDNKKVMLIVSGLLLLVMVTVAAINKYPYQKFVLYSWNNYCDYYYNRCSPESAQFLREHKLTNNLFSAYTWGGWLIWNYPQIKPTIDGRMHIWEDEKGYSGFVDYYKYEQNMKEIDKSSYDVVYMPPDKPIYNHMLLLVEKKKWDLVYEDNYAGIFVRK
jgi:hypothetical protein